VLVVPPLGGALGSFSDHFLEYIFEQKVYTLRNNRTWRCCKAPPEGGTTNMA